MSYITTFEILDEAIKNAGGKPTVLEALWDGDTQGWYLLLFLYSESGIFPFKRTKRHFLSESEVLETLKKMEHFGCVTIDNDEVRITELGRHIL